MKDPKKVARGKKSRASGRQFELSVRKDLESKGWTACKWSNNVENNMLVQSKPKFNPFTKSLMMNGSGFPDFIAMKLIVDGSKIKSFDCKTSYEVIGVEVKVNGYLDKIEKEKCDWLLKNQIFSKILIAYKGKKGEIEYEEYGRK